MSTMTVKNAAGGDETVEKPLVPGRAAATASRPVVLSTEDLAALNAVTTAIENITVPAPEGGATSAKQDALSALVGEVQASPTANTVLDRLKAISTKLDSMITYVDGLEGLATTLNGFVDGLEALVGTTNTSLTTLAGYTDGLEALITTLNGYVDGLETLAGAATPAGSNIIGKVEHTTTGIGHGSKAVTTAGTDVVLASSTPAKWVTIQARRSNTANIAVGGAGVDATASTGDGVTLSAGETITLPIDNLADVYIDATVNGEGVRYTYGT